MELLNKVLTDKELGLFFEKSVYLNYSTSGVYLYMDLEDFKQECYIYISKAPVLNSDHLKGLIVHCIKYCLKKSDLNKNICDVDTSHYASCINNKSYIVKSSGVIKSNNISKEINNINGGTIVKINPNLTLNEFKVYLSKIKYNNLEIIDLLDLIKE